MLEILINLHSWPAKCYIIPVCILSVACNITRFFELDVVKVEKKPPGIKSINLIFSSIPFYTQKFGWKDLRGNKYEEDEDGNMTLISENSGHEYPTVYHLRPTELRSVENIHISRCNVLFCVRLAF